MNTTLSGSALLALSWFAATTIPSSDDRAPEAALVYELRAAGLLSPAGMPTEKGDALLRGSRVVVAEERVSHATYGDAVAIVRVVTAGRGARRVFWTETEIRIGALRFSYSDERALVKLASRAETLDRLAFCYRAVVVRGTGYNSMPFRHVG